MRDAKRSLGFITVLPIVKRVLLALPGRQSRCGPGEAGVARTEGTQTSRGR